VSSALFDSVTRIARHEASARPAVAIGVVRDVFDGSGSPPDHAVTVELRESGLVLPEVPVAVGALGTAATPEPGELVVVVFADGDVHAPVVVGRLYHADLAPPDHGPGDVVLRLPAGSSSPTFQAVLRGADPKLTINLGEDVQLEADDATVHLKVGDAEAKLESAGGGRAEIIVGDATITLTGRGDMELKTTGKITLQGADVVLKGDSSVTISAPQVKVN
jgi:phage baseplate assembly protein gpV